MNVWILFVINSFISFGTPQDIPVHVGGIFTTEQECQAQKTIHQNNTAFCVKAE